MLEECLHSTQRRLVFPKIQGERFNEFGCDSFWCRRFRRKRNFHTVRDLPGSQLHLLVDQMRDVCRRQSDGDSWNRKRVGNVRNGTYDWRCTKWNGWKRSYNVLRRQTQVNRFDGRSMAVVPEPRETGEHVVPSVMLLESVRQRQFCCWRGTTRYFDCKN